MTAQGTASHVRHPRANGQRDKRQTSAKPAPTSESIVEMKYSGDLVGVYRQEWGTCTDRKTGSFETLVKDLVVVVEFLDQRLLRF